MHTLILRKGTAERWMVNNRVLAAGEPGYETDTKILKIGDGVTRWSELPVYMTRDSIIALVQEMLAEVPTQPTPGQPSDDNDPGDLAGYWTNIMTT